MYTDSDTAAEHRAKRAVLSAKNKVDKLSSTLVAAEHRVNMTQKSTQEYFESHGHGHGVQF